MQGRDTGLFQNLHERVKGKEQLKHSLRKKTKEE